MRCVEVVVVLSVLSVLPRPAPAWKADLVKTWAQKLGDELWNLNEALTMSDRIKTKYKKMNASVKKKDGKHILESSLQSVSTMLTRKINAVKCIHRRAKDLAREAANFNFSMYDTDNFTYCSAKYSNFTYEDLTSSFSDDDELPMFVKEHPEHFMDVSLERDSHFYNISVNTNMSCVHVPTNIYHKEEEVLKAILWSKGLNDIFLTNYQSDPSLSWQYFGSSQGILRFYPAMPWQKNDYLYDCRVKSWYIEAATCSKDVIILFDVSGSMTGFKNYVARRTLKSLLDTLSNNDYVNVYTVKNATNKVVSCFDKLVQATPENLETIFNTLQPTDDGKKHKVPLEGNANLTTAYITAFTALKKRRGNCNVQSSQGCNQLVMLITDYVPGNLTEVFEEHNREVVGGRTYIPVRVFTYLIGKEVTNVQEIQWMACLNRGYFVHIHSVEEVQQQVLKYINVIARPMILDGGEPPPTWTHANIDNTRTTSGWNVSGEVDKPDEDKLVTSVAIPAFDYEYSDGPDEPMLLGVAGTDVPIDSIAKLAQPHQLGVNGYSFIVSNNGYLLLHPLLIATINDKLQMNYNSVDFVEVEQVDDGKGPRELGQEIQELRKSLVDGEKGFKKKIKVLYHYDRMRRIARVKHDYFFNKLVGTPFSMGISLPRGYGDTELLLKANPIEAEKGKSLVGVNVTDYFNFSYRIHPDWVYCKYHYLEGHETENMEIEMWNFLVNISRNELDISKKQYGQGTQSPEFNYEEHCGNGTTSLGIDEYYCNDDLVKQLVFDAKLSSPYFKSWNVSEVERELARTYNVSVRFIATASGLTRWHYIFDEHKNEWVDDAGRRHKRYDGKVFGDYYHNAIEETWYRAAVLQHIINKESLVVATPLPILDEVIDNRPPVINQDDVEITASYAIFYKDGESETPASVVGFQFYYRNFLQRFLEITEKSHKGSKTNRNSNNDDISCTGSNYDCYIIDSSGYVVISRDINEVGQFFGVINQHVLQAFIETSIFEHVEVFNYQALCPISILTSPNRSWSLITPFSMVGTLLRWLVTEIVLLLSNCNFYTFGAPLPEDDYIEDLTTASPAPEDDNQTASPPKLPKDSLFSCDHRISLYILNQSRFLENMTPISEEEGTKCHPPYWASYIPRTNLLLVVVERGWMMNEDCPRPPDTKPTPTTDSTTSREPCHKLALGELHRRRLEGCFTYNEKERNITACGLGHSISADGFTAISLAVVLPFMSTLLF